MKLVKRSFLLLTRLYYYYHRLLRRPLVRSVRYSAFFIITFPLLLFVSCNNKDTSSPFDEILSQPPYSSLTDSIKDQPKNDELWFRRAVLLNKNNLPEPALADFQKAWSLNKRESYAFGITNIWLAKKPDSAIIFLNEALKELPKSFLLQVTLARTYDALNKTEDALKVCNQLLLTYPTEINVLVMQSELLEKKGDAQGSINSLEKASFLNRANLDLALKLAYKYAENKDPKVLGFCDSLIKKDSLHLNEEPYYIKGVYYSNIKERAKAIRLFDEIIRHNYNYLNAYIEKGKILVDQKNYVEAYKVFKLSNTISPAFPDAWYWMGVCQEGLGQTDEARLSYQKAYGLDKTFTEAKEAADRLGG